jgi:DNA-binding SARP family transcriptional activator
MYQIKLLGSGQVLYGDKAMNGFPGQQHSLLFYYLLLNRQISHTREQIAAVFWGDDPTPVARKNLRNAIWRLGQSFRSVGASLEDLICIQEEYISFLPRESLLVDMDELEGAARFCLDLTNRDLSPALASRLETAADLYKGDLLEGVYDDWCIFERERLRLAYLNILDKLMEHHSHQGQYVRSLEYGQRILQLDPTREKVHREIMLLQWMNGNRDAALTQYRSCLDILQAELGIEPMQETRHLHETILRSSSPVHAEANRPPAFNNISNSHSGSLLQEMLQKLHMLEMIVDQTNTELHLLEGMIQRVIQAK